MTAEVVGALEFVPELRVPVLRFLEGAGQRHPAACFSDSTAAPQKGSVRVLCSLTEDDAVWGNRREFADVLGGFGSDYDATLQDHLPWANLWHGDVPLRADGSQELQEVVGI